MISLVLTVLMAALLAVALAVRRRSPPVALGCPLYTSYHA